MPTSTPNVASATSTPAAVTHRAAELYLALVALIWGVNFSVIKSAFAWVSPFGFNALRFPLACAVMLVLLRGRGMGVALPAPALRRVALLGIVGHCGYQVLFIYGLSVTLAGNASVLLATTPIWTTLLSGWAGHEPIDGRLWLAAAGTVGGVTLVTLGGGAAIGGEVEGLLGDLAMVGAAMVWSVYTVGGRPLVREHGALRVTAWALWFGTLPLVLLGTPGVMAVDLAAAPPSFWGRVIFAGALGIAVAYLIWYQGVRTLGSARTAIFGNAVPVVALIVAWVWLGERPAPLQLLGAALILLALRLSRGSSPQRAARV